MSRRREREKEEGASEDAPVVLYVSPEENFQLSQGYKQFHRKFRTQYKINQWSKDDITADALEGVRAIILARPNKAFEPEEIKVLKKFMEEGGGVMVMANEGKEEQSFQHINKLTDEYGITIAHDAIVRTVYFRDYYHPKEAFIKNASLVPTLDKISGKTGKSSENVSALDDMEGGHKLSVAYPYGCSIQLHMPARPLLSSGLLAFPANRCLCAYSQVGKGRLIVLGSALCFEDQYLVKADNIHLANGLMTLLTETVKLENTDPDRPEFGERMEIPDTESLAERLRACLQEGEELPVDFTHLFDHQLFKYDTGRIPEAVKLYDKLNVKHDPLSLIPPQFEVPLPPLQPAVFMPWMRELPSPSLDLFDLDEAFSSEKLRLAQLTNKCTDKDLDYFVRESGEILGVADAIREEMQLPNLTAEEKSVMPINAKKILEYILQKLVAYKKIEQEDQQGQQGDGEGFESSMGPGGNNMMSMGENQVSDTDLDAINNMDLQSSDQATAEDLAMM
jgi:intraflagellar transport protein 52